MFSDFLKGCSCLLTDEQEDFEAVKRELSGSAYVSFMPAIIEDMWPLYVLECTAARKYGAEAGKKHICIVPMGAHDFWSRPGVKELVEGFYEQDELPGSELSYGAELDEMLLLRSADVCRPLELNGIGEVRVIFAKISMGNGRQVCLFAVPDEAHVCWANIMERYDIACDMLIDSSKGLGDWFDCVPLYKAFHNAEKPYLLPTGYFKGKYISHDAPEGCRLMYEVPESRENQCISKIYRTNWREKFGR